MLRYWNVDINEISIRRMRNLFFRLPNDSEVNVELGDFTPESRIWTPDIYMLANVIDALMYVAWSVQAANSKRPPSKPKPIKRPKLQNKNPTPPKVRWPGRTVVVKKEGNADG